MGQQFLLKKKKWISKYMLPIFCQKTCDNFFKLQMWSVQLVKRY